MANNAVDLFFQHLRIILDPERRSTDTDGQLLARWVSARDGRAFAALVARHGALVWRASRGVLHLREDTEDVFQATFLMLARKAAGLQKHSSITGWLYQTASRLALKARTAKLRRLRHEEQAGPKMAVDPLEEISVREARTILGEELERLSAVHREAILLCLYEGATQDEAAKRLGCSLNTLKRRLERGRSLLGKRLTKRGLAPENAFALTLCADIKIPVQLVHQTITLASKFAAGEALTGTAALLAEGALRTIMVKKLVVGFAVILGGLTMVAGTLRVPSAEPGANGIKAVALNAGHGTRSVPATKAAPPENDEREARLDVNGDPLPDGAIQRIGSSRFRNSAAVDKMHYTPDGKTLLSISTDAFLHVWDAETGKLRWRFKMDSVIYEHSVVFGVDSKTVAVLGNSGFKFFNTETGKPAKPLEEEEKAKNARHRDDVTPGTFAPDGKTVAIGSFRGGISFWDIASGKPVPPSPEPWELIRIRFANQGKEILCLGNSVTWWDVSTAKLVRSIPLDPRWSNGLRMHKVSSISPDGKILAAFPQNDSGIIEKGEIVLIESQSGRILHTLTGHTKKPSASAFSPDATKLYTAGGPDPRIILWDVATGKALNAFKVHLDRVDRIAVSPDGRWLASASRSLINRSDFDIRLLNLDTGKVVHRLTPRSEFAYCLEFSADSSLLVSGHFDQITGNMQLWDVISGKEIHFVNEHVRCVAISPNGRMLATGGQDNKLRLWEISTGKERGQIPGHDRPVFSLDFSPGGNLLAAASGDAPIYLWNPYALKKSKTPQTKLAKEDREKLWQKLADTDAAAAFKAICELIARPNEAVGLLEDEWKRMPRATVKQMRPWVEELNSAQFAVRKNATEELVRFAASHEDMLRDALQKPASLEARQRLERILAQIEPERLRRGRMLEVLEQVRTAQARQFLQSLAEQNEDAALAREATAGLKRLAGE